MRKISLAVHGSLIRSTAYSRSSTRNITSIKKRHTADLVVVDAAHDFDNEYADLQLALTACPKFIFVDDAEDETQARPAIQKFLETDLKDRSDYTLPIEYIGRGLVIKLKE